jgi:hypothetical protein
MGRTMITLLLFIAADAVAANPAPPVTTPPPVNIAEPNPKTMSQREIKEFNAQLTQNHPFYIRCVKSAETGSLIKRNLSCRTNKKWKEAADRGNEEARAIIDEMASKSWNSSG